LLQRRIGPDDDQGLANQAGRSYDVGVIGWTQRRPHIGLIARAPAESLIKWGLFVRPPIYPAAIIGF
jgi:hypothetical protein